MFTGKLRGRFLFIALGLVATVLWSSCVPEQPAPERLFTTRDLLIGVSDMPPGWKVGYGPGKGRDYISPQDGSEIGFYVNDDVPPGRNTAGHDVYRYRSIKAAKSVYNDLVLPGQVGRPPVGWAYQSPIADQSYFACYDYEGREPYPFCEWSARYEEYVVVFSSWLIPGYMSLEDMERVVRAIDARMATYLGKPLPTPEP